MPDIDWNFSIRETVICPSCHLNQYAMAVGRHEASAQCCRCGRPLGMAYYRFQTSGLCGEGQIPGRAAIQRSIGAFIRRLRMRRHVSQEVLACRMAMHRTVITKAEGGHFQNLSLLLQAAAALDLEIDQVFVRVRDRGSRKVSLPVSGDGN